MKKLLLVLSLLICSIIAKAQWVDLATSINGDLRTVYFNHIDSGMVGGNAGIYRTSDGGLTWAKQNILNNFIDSLILEGSVIKSIFEYNGFWYAAGKDTVNGAGVIFRRSYTLDWELSFTLPGYGFNGLSGANNQVVCIGDGGNIYFTVNNGLIWSSTVSGVTSNLNSVHSNAVTYVGGDSTILKVVNQYNFSNGFSVVSTNRVDNLFMRTFSNVYTVNNNEIRYGQNSSWTVHPYYNGALNGTSISFANSNEAFISTKNGILKSINNISYWERFSGTSGYNLNDIYFIYNTSIGYAVGANGLILKTTNKGGVGMPYMSFDADNGGCVNSNVIFYNYGPSSYWYTWKINGVQFSNTKNANMFFSTPGTYTVTLVVDNGWNIDSLQTTFEIVTPPETNKTISVMTPLICKLGNSDVIVFSSQINTSYDLVRVSDAFVVSSVLGNGGNVVLNTGSITDSTKYVIKAKSTLANCEVFLTDTVVVGVEKTTAKFHPNLINAKLDENIIFNNNSIQADTYQWDFGLGASVLSSTSFEEILSYNQLGQKQVRLIAASQYGCIDTLIKNASFIYDEATMHDNCWALNFDGNRVNTYEHDIGEEIEIAENGDILTSGSFNECEFLTKAGITEGRHIGIGFYIARYTTDGVLKWLVRGEDQVAHGGTTGIGSAYSLTTDKNGNIYVTGWMDQDFILYSNDGKLIPLGNYNQGFILKLDSNGSYQWHSGLHNANGTSISLDDSNNIYVEGVYQFTATFYSLSGISLQKTAPNYDASFILKMDSLGEILWLTDVVSNSWQSESLIKEMVTDKYGNVYLTGYRTAWATFNSISGPPITLNSGGGPAFVAKYNSMGNVQWAHSFGSTVLVGSRYDKGLSIDVNDNGDSYIALEVTSNKTSEYFVVPSSQGTFDTLSLGGYALISYDSNGNFRWGTGIKYAYTGRGTAVTLDDFGNVYTSGYVRNLIPPAFGDFVSTDTNKINLPVQNGTIFIAKYNEFGKIIWASLESGLTSNNQAVSCTPNALAVDKNQNLYMTGELSRFTYAPGYYIATDSLFTNEQDAFIAKFSSSACLQPDSIMAFSSYGTHCVNDTVVVPILVSPSITLLPGNVYQLELSDPFGNFSSPQIIGTLNSANNIDTVIGTLSGIVIGGNYSIRVVSSQPSIIGNETPISTNGGQTLQNISICQGDSIFLKGNYQTVAGVYIDSLQTIYGCDSILSTTLIVNPLPNVAIASFNQDTLCFNGNIVGLPIGTPSGGSYSGIGVSGGDFNPSTAGTGTHNVIYTFTDTNSCINSDTTIITVQLCTGVDNISNDFGLLIYPNPNTGLFTIEKPSGLNKEVQVKLLDATSKLIFDKVISIGQQKIDIDITNYSKGIYYLQLIIDNETFVKQVLKN